MIVGAAVLQAAGHYSTGDELYEAPHFSVLCFDTSKLRDADVTLDRNNDALYVDTPHINVTYAGHLSLECTHHINVYAVTVKDVSVPRNTVMSMILGQFDMDPVRGFIGADGTLYATPEMRNALETGTYKVHKSIPLDRLVLYEDRGFVVDLSGHPVRREAVITQHNQISMLSRIHERGYKVDDITIEDCALTQDAIDLILSIKIWQLTFKGNCTLPTELLWSDVDVLGFIDMALGRVALGPEHYNVVINNCTGRISVHHNTHVDVADSRVTVVYL